VKGQHIEPIHAAPHTPGGRHIARPPLYIFMYVLVRSSHVG
jgi:hypothetical protein